MVRLSQSRIDYLMEEDVPYIDLTSEVLGIGDVPGEMEYFSREACIVAGVEETARIASSMGCEVLHRVNAGDRVERKELLVEYTVFVYAELYAISAKKLVYLVCIADSLHKSFLHKLSHIFHSFTKHEKALAPNGSSAFALYFISLYHFK